MPPGKRKKYIDRDEYNSANATKIPRSTMFRHRAELIHSSAACAPENSLRLSDDGRTSGHRNISLEMQNNERGPHNSDDIHVNSDIHISCNSDNEISDNMYCETTTESEDDTDNTNIGFAMNSDDGEDNISIASENDRGTCNDVRGVELDVTNDLNNESAGHNSWTNSDFNSVFAKLTSDQPLHSHTRTSLSQAFLLTLSFTLHHSLSYDALDDMLKLMQVLLPAANLFPESKYMFLKVFNAEGIENICEMKFYCKACYLLIDNASTETSNCPHCGEAFNKQSSKKEGSFFLYFNLASQLKNILEMNGIWELILQQKEMNRDCHGKVRDVANGKLYKECNLLKEDIRNLSLTLFCDGIKIFKSSRYNIWPIYCTINELPLSHRKSNVLLVSLWFGNKKPVMHGNFWKPFVDEARRLQTEGCFWKHPVENVQYRTKVACLLCICDAPAKAQVQNAKMYNGEFGCPCCLHPGERIKTGNGHSRVYTVKDPTPRLRSHVGVRSAAAEALFQGKAVEGIKGPSDLLLLAPSFNIVESFTVDFMHACLLGVTRAMSNAWLDNYGEPYYLCPQLVNELDARIKGIHPPCNITRILRTTKDRFNWKANELQQFVLNSPVLLINILPKRYYDHWLMFSTAIYILLGDCVSHSELAQCEVMLCVFVSKIEQLYGKQYHTYNMHMLTHLVQSIRDTGPMSSGSAFLFEDLNGKMKRLVKGTRGAHFQIAKKFMLLRVIRQVLQVEAQKPCCNQKVGNLLKHLIHGYPLVQSQKKWGDCTLFGKGILRECRVHHRFMLCEFIGAELPERVVYHKKLKFGPHIIKCYNENNNCRTNDSVIVVDGVFCEVHAIVSIGTTDHDGPTDVFLICRKVKVKRIGTLCTDCNVRVRMHVAYVCELGETFVAKPVQIEKKCFVLDLPKLVIYSNYMYAIIPLPNVTESNV